MRPASSIAVAPKAIGVVVPAHNEEQRIASCLSSIGRAARAPTLLGTRVHVVVVCDACDDRTADIAEAFGCTTLICRERNVGAARAFGAQAALELGADWLAFTDADTVVCGRWLESQLALDSDVVCGTVGVHDWHAHDDAVRAQFEQNYRDEDGHRHIHGANLGISASAYRSVGGFTRLANSEDVAIIEALDAAGARIAWSAAPRVMTSARVDFKASAGFGANLISMASTLVADATHFCSMPHPDPDSVFATPLA
jgi:glycosyltransferase involved in cell wall biosynthesis